MLIRKRTLMTIGLLAEIALAASSITVVGNANLLRRKRIYSENINF